MTRKLESDPDPLTPSPLHTCFTLHLALARSRQRMVALHLGAEPEGEPEGEVEDDETFLRSMGDIYVHIDDSELGLWFAEFQKLQEGGGLDARVGWDKIPMLLKACGLEGSYRDEIFTPEGVAEVLWLQSEQQRESTQGSPKGGTATIHSASKDQIAPYLTTVQGSISFEQFVAACNFAASEAKQDTNNPLFPFDPDSTAKQTWDAFIMLFLLYTTFAVPYMLSFGEKPESEAEEAASIQPVWGAYEIFDLFMDVLFCMDVCANFCTAIVIRGVYITNLQKIAVNYIKTWFILDFAGSVPFDKIVSAAVGAGNDMGGLLKALRLVRILKIIRAVRFLQKLSALEARDTTGSLKTFVSIFRAWYLMIFVAHLLACGFFMIIDKDTTDNWMSAVDPEYLDFSKSSNDQRYILGLYWAIITICTVGYGDISPVNHMERIFGLISAMIGGIVFSYSLGSITQLIQAKNGSNKRFEDTLMEVREYLEFRISKPDLRRRIVNFYARSYRSSGSLYKEQALISLMPDDVRSVLLKAISEDAQKTIPFLSAKGLEDQETLGHIYIRMQPHFFDKEESIYKAEQPGDEMFFIEKGEVTLDRPKFRRGVMISQDAPKKPFQQPTYSEAFKNAFPVEAHLSTETLGSGDTFGEVCLFPHICKYRYQNATAVSEVSLFLLSRAALDEIKVISPAFYSKLEDLARLRAAIAGGVSNDAFEGKARQEDKGPRSKLEQEIRNFQSDLLAVYEKGFSSLAMETTQIPAQASKSAPNKIHSPHTPSSRHLLTSQAVFRGWLLNEDNASDFSVDQDCQPRSHTSVREVDMESARLWLKISGCLMPDGQMIVIFDNVKALVDLGPTCLGCVVPDPSRLDGTVVETWPISQETSQQYLSQGFTVGLTFHVRGAGQRILRVRVGLEKEPALRLTRTLERCCNNVKTRLQTAEEYPAAAAETSMGAEPSCITSGWESLGNRAMLSNTRGLNENGDGDIEISGSNCELPLHHLQQRTGSGSNGSTESILQDVLRRMDAMQQQMREVTAVKHEVADLKATLIALFGNQASDFGDGVESD